MGDSFIDAYTGEVRISSKPAVLRAMAIGSCVVVAAYDRDRKIGGLAHIMLPGRSLSKSNTDKTKYAEDAIDVLLDAVKKSGGKVRDLEVNVIGGADVIGGGTIPQEIVSSVLNYLKRLSIEPKKKKTGGTRRRSVSLDTKSGRIFYSEGDNPIEELQA